MDDEYIRRWVAIDSVTNDALERNLDSVMTDEASRYHRSAERVLAGLPYIKITHCRDCQYADEPNHCSLFGWLPMSTDFCSRGIRKNQNNKGD